MIEALGAVVAALALAAAVFAALWQSERARAGALEADLLEALKGRAQGSDRTERLERVIHQLRAELVSRSLYCATPADVLSRLDRLLEPDGHDPGRAVPP